MNAAERPTIATYEADSEGLEQLVHRPMTDDELAQWEDDRAAYLAAQAEAEARPAPFTDDEIERLRALLEVV